MSSNDPYQGQPGPYGQGGQGGPPPGPYGYPQQPNTPPGPGGYAFGPFAPAAGYGSRADPAGPPPASMPGPIPQPGQPPRRGKGLIILGVVALALILIGITTALVLRPEQPNVQPQRTATQAPTGTSSASPQTSAPPAGAPGLRRGRRLPERPGRRGRRRSAVVRGRRRCPPGPFMTDKVLAESIKRAPITQIDVPVGRATRRRRTVPRHVHLGQDPGEHRDYDVQQVSGAWKLTAVNKTLDLGLVRVPVDPDADQRREGQLGLRGRAARHVRLHHRVAAT